MAEFDLLASAAFGMEAIVVRELRDLGYPDATVEDGRIRFRGDLAAICRTNLWLRCAERVQVVVADFKARDFDELFDQIKAIAWEEWLPVDAKFPVTARCVRSDIKSVPNTQKMVKRAIVDRLRQVYSRHWFEEIGSEYNIDASILGDRVLVTIDTTGDGLHKRGYRKLVGQAPLRETLAAALVKLSYWHRDRLLVDPFCGSGTIPIEAAMIGRNLAPGRNRSFIAENWGQIPRDVWSTARQEVKDLESRQPLSIPIVATDRDRYAIKMAVQHARHAGVETDIHFDVKDFVAFPTNRDAGILICNPPYGERLGEEQEVRQLYSDMGELLRPLDDWSLYILTGAEGFERDFGKRADRRRKLYNARIACTYYQYLGPKPAGVEQQEDEGAPAEEAVKVKERRSWEEEPRREFIPKPVVHEDPDVALEGELSPGKESAPVQPTLRPAEAQEKPLSPWDRARLQRTQPQTPSNEKPAATPPKTETPVSSRTDDAETETAVKVVPAELIEEAEAAPDSSQVVTHSENVLEAPAESETELVSETVSEPEKKEQPTISAPASPWAKLKGKESEPESVEPQEPVQADVSHDEPAPSVPVAEVIGGSSAEEEVSEPVNEQSNESAVSQDEVAAPPPPPVTVPVPEEKPEPVQAPEAAPEAASKPDSESATPVNHPWKRMPWQRKP